MESALRLRQANRRSSSAIPAARSDSSPRRSSISATTSRSPLLVPLTSEYRGRLARGDGRRRGENAHRPTTASTALRTATRFTSVSGRRCVTRNSAVRLSKAERELRDKVKGKAEIGDPWTEIDQAVAKFRPYYTDYFMLEDRPGWRTDLFMYARELVRSAIERDKPPTERLPGLWGIASAVARETDQRRKADLSVAGRNDDGVLALENPRAADRGRSARERIARQRIARTAREASRQRARSSATRRCARSYGAAARKRCRRRRTR